MKDTMIQWHPGFVAAMNLELAENQEDLIFEKEYNLNTKPLLVDLLIIKKEAPNRIENEIGAIFRQYNIIEYKSPKDRFDIDVVYKTIAYACLYKSYGETVNKRDAKEITVSIVREAKPIGLFRYCKQAGILVEKRYNGIYYVLNQWLFPVQLIITKELDREAHIWLKALTEKMEEQEMRRLLEQIQQLGKKQEKEFADSILEVSVKANKKILNEIRGDDQMCQALLELMEPEINEIKRKAEEQGIERGIEKGIEQGIEKGLEQGIRQLIIILQELGYENEMIKTLIMKKYSLSKEKIATYFINL